MFFQRLGNITLCGIGFFITSASAWVSPKTSTRKSKCGTVSSPALFLFTHN